MTKNQEKSKQIMERSSKVFPGGVNSPVRSFRSVGGTPVVFSHGKGKYLYDVDGNQYVDFCSSWGPLILGYSNPEVISAIEDQIQKSVTFGAPSEAELNLAEKIKSWIPGIDLLRFVSSGTEATMSALRAARAATGKDKFIKFEGCYHGHADCFLVSAGSGLATLGNPSSSGVPHKGIEDTLVAVYNDVQSVEKIFEQYGNEIAAVIVEPVAANMGLVLPEPGFLKFLREITEKNKAILIFDEVMTGFRLAQGGAASYFHVSPDLWTFGKIIGGGLPCAAYGGKYEIMKNIAPLGKAYQAGTLSGNPLAMIAGLATLNEMENRNAFDLLEEKGNQLDQLVEQNLADLIKDNRLCYKRIASFFCFFFGTNQAPKNFSQVSQTNMDLFNKVYHAWLDAGIYLGPSGYEVGFLSTEIQEEDMLKLVSVIRNILIS
jgi:glutamate-1-semialdehyde 2,1-aminomutase